MPKHTDMHGCARATAAAKVELRLKLQRERKQQQRLRKKAGASWPTGRPSKLQRFHRASCSQKLGSSSAREPSSSPPLSDVACNICCFTPTPPNKLRTMACCLQAVCQTCFGRFHRSHRTECRTTYGRRGSLLLATCAAVNCFAPASNASPAPSEVQVVLLASMHE